MESIPAISMAAFDTVRSPHLLLPLSILTPSASLQTDAGPTFAFQPATPSFNSQPKDSGAQYASTATPFDNVNFSRDDHSPTIAPAGSISPSALSAGFPDVPDNISEVGSSAGGAASLLAFAQLGAASNADATEAAQLNAMSPHILPATSPDSFVGSLPAMPEPLPGASGPIRNRRGGGKDLSLDLGSDLGLSFDFLRDYDPSQGENKENEGSETPEGGRVIKMGDHTFTIPLKSPTVAPQLQSSVRITSTGKPSHARKVPEGHVKRPRNAFILFRSYACTNNLLPASLGITDHRQVSRVVGQLWKGLKPEEKSIWEKKAQEEKEEHRRNNPNYRYRPVFNRKEVPAKKRRRKPTEDEQIEEEERKSEVVARVLLEGRDVSHEELEEEVEQQKIQDQIEGKERGRARSRSKSVNRNQTLDGFVGLSRPSSAPPGQDDEYDEMYGGTHLGVAKKHATRARRSRTLATTKADYEVPQQYSQSYPEQGLMDFGEQPGFGIGHGMASRYPLPPNIIAPSPRSVSNLSGLFANGDVPVPGDFGSSFTGFKSGLGDNLSLVSPSFSRKFSLGRWEVPDQRTGMGMYEGSHLGDQAGFNAPFAPNEVASNSSYGSADHHNNYTYDAQAPGAPAFAEEQPVPTYVYLSKQDAQNPEVRDLRLSAEDLADLLPLLRSSTTICLKDTVSPTMRRYAMPFLSRCIDLEVYGLCNTFDSQLAIRI